MFTRCFLLAAIVVLGGCMPDRPAYTAEPDPVGDYPEIVLTPALRNKLVRFEPVVVPATDDQPMKVRVPLRSRVDEVLYVQYRVIFYGPDMEQLTRYPVWYDLRIDKRTRVVISANSISQKATSWVLEVRPL